MKFFQLIPSILALLFANATAYSQNLLPPVADWHGKSESLMKTGIDPLITPFELSGGTRSATLAETRDWFKKLEKLSKNVQLVNMGLSAEGREMLLVKVSSDDHFKYGTITNSDRPTVLIQAGIHSGEIDGKDAGMMLLRDIAVGNKSGLLKGINILFIPILNIDGHERASEYGRINQRGPEVIGWRTNARNLNLNRDYAKVDTEELRAVMKVINEYDPQLYLDIHVTDGVDYQYDVTYGYIDSNGYSPACSDWLQTFFEPFVNEELTMMGHIPGQLVFAKNDRDMQAGNVNYISEPRFSNAYGNVRHLPSILVENHSLKPYKQRVLGTYVFLEAAIKIMSESRLELKNAIESDKKKRPELVPLTWKLNENLTDSVWFSGIESTLKKSIVTGAEYVDWTAKPTKQYIPLFKHNVPELLVNRPETYIVPVANKDVIERLEIHGIKMVKLTAPETLEVEMYRIKDMKVVGKLPFQGRMRMSGITIKEKRTRIFPAGSVRISTNQPLGDLAVLLLEPDSPDSFLQWGFYAGISERTEYFEVYVMEKLALKMMNENPELKREFESKKSSDASFSADQWAQLHWWYEKTPYSDQEYLLYPVGRILN